MVCVVMVCVAAALQARGEFLNHIPINLYPLGRTRNIPLSWPNPMSYHSSAENVGYELILLSIPHEQSRTGTAATVEFGVILLAVGGDFYFILQHASGP